MSEEQSSVLLAFEQSIFPTSQLSNAALHQQLRKPGAGYYLKKDTRGVPLGYALFQDDGPLRDILRLGVREDARCHGVGSTMLSCLCHDAFFGSGHQLVLLSVEKKNYRAINFYKEHHFTPVGHTDTHYLLELKKTNFSWDKYNEATSSLGKEGLLWPWSFCSQ
jgi:ribosomal protein S18 acetylase RimI-like enzyme